MPKPRAPAPSPDPFLTEALTLADDYAASAVSHGEYTNWVGRHILEGASKPEETATQSKALNFSIYSGVAGVSLFLGNAYRFSRDPVHFDVARGGILEAIRQVQRVVDTSNEKNKREIWGFYSGAVGVYWTAHELASILEDPYLAERAALLLDGLKKEIDNKETETDVIGGHAGAIPAFLSLARNHGVKEGREIAEALGEQLIARAVKTPGGGWGWERVGRAFPRPLTGFTHGAAGHAYAFAHLYQETGAAKWKEAAQGAILYERESYDPVQRAWPDWRFPVPEGGRPRCAALWCHGSGGIGMSRVLMHETLEDPEMLDEARIARIDTGRHTRQRLEVPGHIYHLCHGIAGNAECLWIMEAGLGIPGALGHAREIGLYGIERFGHVAKARWSDRFVDWPSPHPGHRELSLLTGVAGIGYSYLRLHAPDKVASALVPGLSWKDAASVPYRSAEERLAPHLVGVAK